MRLKLRYLIALALGLVAAVAVAGGLSGGLAPKRRGRPGRSKLILTLGPGSGADIGARLLADRLGATLGPTGDRRKPARRRRPRRHQCIRHRA